LFRSSPIAPEEYFRLSKREKADAIWRALFVERAPVSEATRGVVAVLQAFGLSSQSPDLTEAREFFESQTLDAHIKPRLPIGGHRRGGDDQRSPRPERGPHVGARRGPRHAVFTPSCGWTASSRNGPNIGGRWRDGLPRRRQRRRRVGRRGAAIPREWYERMRPVYMAVSLTDTFQFPEDSVRSRLLSEAVLPACREFGIPLSLMIGVRRLVNPALRLAGDAVGKADLRAVECLCRDCPDNRFLVSVLSRENQHELCVYARKFANLMPFGCWWFLNNPSVVEEMTRERLEMLGTTFIPQHSDARILEQVIYK